MSATVLLVTFFGLLLLGCPIAISLGLSGVLTLVFVLDIPLSIVSSSFFSGAFSFSLMAIPLFIFAGGIMEIGGISKRLIRLAELILGDIKGSLGAVMIITCMFFAAICGSGPATVAALGGILIPKMISEGYDKNYCGAAISAAGAIGVVIPPSIILIVYGIVAGPSIGALFTASIIPGILMGLAFLVVNYLTSKKHGYGSGAKRGTPREIWEAFKDAFWGMMSPVIIFGGIYSGVFTATESAAIACVWGIIVGVFIYKEVNFQQLVGSLYDAAISSATIMLIVGCSSIFSWVLSTERIASGIANAILAFSDNPVVILLCINIILLIAGCFMVSVEAIYILCPIIIPLVNALGIDLVHMGIILNVNLAIGLFTPPVGVNLYVAGGISDSLVKDVSKSAVPFILAGLIVLMLITYIPELSMWLPAKLGMFT